MLKCDKRVYKQCPDKEYCDSLDNAVFVEGSECDKYNRMVINAHPTNADRIRAMSDDELAEALSEYCVAGDIRFCTNKQQCLDAIENGEDIPMNSCNECLLEWLRQTEEAQNNVGKN